MSAPALELPGSDRSAKPLWHLALPPNVTLAFLLALVLLVGAAVGVTRGMTFPLYRDETQFWVEARTFASDWPPGIEQLRTYPEPMTPLAFVIWGGVERAFGAGIAGLRLFDLLLCVAVLGLIGLPAGREDRRAPLCALGLVGCPYFLGVGIHLYTDGLAVFFVVLGLWLDARGRAWAGAAALALAIATRQYMVAFPAALAAAAALEALRGERSRWRSAVLPHAVSAATLLGWFAFFGGLSPAAGSEAWPRHTDALGSVNLRAGLYLLSCLGAYFVVPELILFRRDALRRLPPPRACAVVGGAVALAFALAPVCFDGRPGGVLSRAVHWVGMQPVEAWFYAALGVLAAVRFARADAAACLVCFNLGILLTAWASWEKYYLPLVAALWLLSSREGIPAPAFPRPRPRPLGATPARYRKIWPRRYSTA